ncbi:MAG: hypothetical protein KDA78_21765, partial [Planctomycetaceae bacterium]|nr:hypothetical protein [Planctomycetaceae bacterium]
VFQLRSPTRAFKMRLETFRPVVLLCGSLFHPNTMMMLARSHWSLTDHLKSLIGFVDIVEKLMGLHLMRVGIARHHGFFNSFKPLGFQDSSTGCCCLPGSCT